MRIYDSQGNFRSDMSDKEGVSTAIKLMLTFFAIVFIVSVLVWLTEAGLAPWTGRVNQQHIINDPHNQISQYQEFFQLDADIHTGQTQIRNLSGQLAQLNKDNPPGTPDPTGQIAQSRAQLRTEISGAASNCTDSVNKYKAMALQYTTQQFRDANLPDTEDPSLCEVPSA